MDRYAEVTRKTGETDIVVKLDLEACALSAKMLFAPSDAGMRETRSCVRASALPKVKGLLVLERRRGVFPLTLPEVP